MATSQYTDALDSTNTSGIISHNAGVKRTVTNKKTTVHAGSTSAKFASNSEIVENTRPAAIISLKIKRLNTTEKKKRVALRSAKTRSEVIL
jgi:hypothetical protein